MLNAELHGKMVGEHSAEENNEVSTPMRGHNSYGGGI